jgi:hypothetical protein
LNQNTYIKDLVSGNLSSTDQTSMYLLQQKNHHAIGYSLDMNHVKRQTLAIVYSTIYINPHERENIPKRTRLNGVT